MLVSSIGLRTRDFRSADFSDQEHQEIEFPEFDGYDDAVGKALPINTENQIVRIYVIRSNFKKDEEHIFIGYCPDIYNREQDCMLPAQVTIHSYDFIPKGYKGGYDHETSISTKPREELVEWMKDLWSRHIELDKEDLDYCADRVLYSNKPEVTPLRRKIAECERFYVSSDVLADFTYNYSKILSEGGNAQAMEIFSDVYLALNKYDLDTYEFSDGFSDMVYRGAAVEELEIYAEAALNLLFIGEFLNDEEDRFGGLNNACVSYVSHERDRDPEKFKLLCNEVIRMTDVRYELNEREEVEALVFK